MSISKAGSRLNLISNHLSAPDKNENLLFKYKAMSMLEPDILRRFINYEIDYELFDKAHRLVMQDKELFESTFYQELDRKTNRSVTNKRLTTIIDEWKKNFSLKEICNDLSQWVAIVA